MAEKNKYVFFDTEGASNDIFNKGYKYVVSNVPLASEYPVETMNFLAAQNPKQHLLMVAAE